MKRETSTAAAARAATSQPEAGPGLLADGPALSATGAAALPAEQWVMDTEQSAVFPLIRAPKAWKYMLALTIPLIAAGVYAWVMQLTVGLGVTGMGNGTPWSLYIVNFVFFIGASAGGIVVASLVYALKLDRYRSVARLAEFTALTCLTLATIFITLDVGRPERLWHLVRYGDIASPLVWDIAIITFYGLLAFALVYFSLRADLARLRAQMPRRRRLYGLLSLGSNDVSPDALKRDKARLRVLAIISIPAAVAVHTVTAWILGVVKAQPGWHSSVLAPMFITSALTSGIALTIVSAVVSRSVLHVKIGDDAIRGLSRILFFAVPLLGYMQLSELVTSIYQREPEGVKVFQEMMFGRYAFLFWLTLLGQLVPFALLWFAERLKIWVITVASALVVLAVLAERWNIVIPSLTATSHLPFVLPGYTPSLPEIIMTVAAYAGGALVYVVLSRFLPMIELTVERE